MTENMITWITLYSKYYEALIGSDRGGGGGSDFPIVYTTIICPLNAARVYVTRRVCAWNFHRTPTLRSFPPLPRPSDPLRICSFVDYSVCSRPLGGLFVV